MTLTIPNPSIHSDVGTRPGPDMPDDRRSAAERQRRWLDENQGAIEDANRFLATHRLWSDGKRLF